MIRQLNSAELISPCFAAAAKAAGETAFNDPIGPAVQAYGLLIFKCRSNKQQTKERRDVHMKKYSDLELEVIRFDTEDVIATSDGDIEGPIV